MNDRLVMSESGDWYVVPDGKQEEFYNAELATADPPDYAIYVQDPESILLIEWEVSRGKI